MKKGVLFLLLFSLGTPVQAKTLTPVDWQRLADCMPALTEIDGFVKDGIEGDSYPQPYASIYYVKSGKGEMGWDYAEMGESLSLSITDCANATEYLNAMLEPSLMDTPLSVNGKYEGKRTLELNDYIIQCGYVFVVRNRFLVELISSGREVAFDQLEKLIAAIKFEQLESIK